MMALAVMTTRRMDSIGGGSFSPIDLFCLQWFPTLILLVLLYLFVPARVVLFCSSCLTLPDPFPTQTPKFLSCLVFVALLTLSKSLGYAATTLDFITPPFFLVLTTSVCHQLQSLLSLGICIPDNALVSVSSFSEIYLSLLSC